eukprot:7721417-Pyramimonas_sp.AAC.1
MAITILRWVLMIRCIATCTSGANLLSHPKAVHLLAVRNAAASDRNIPRWERKYALDDGAHGH